MKTGIRILTLVLTLLMIVLAGTVFFHIVEGWSWLDSYFFTVITLSTVGYGSLVPVTAIGKIGTTIFIFVGLGVFAVTIQQFGIFAFRKREEHVDALFSHLAENHNEKGAPETQGPSAPSEELR